ncbi:hypothetical protein TYRP_001340 [Tyrophagus putrescentiae]|nr:hypothetical protein TYRP_001340 [Tyrophagus putrescentiae]
MTVSDGSNLGEHLPPFCNARNRNVLKANLKNYRHRDDMQTTFSFIWPTNSNECTHITQTDRQTVAWQQFYGNSTTHDYPLTQLP